MAKNIHGGNTGQNMTAPLIFSLVFHLAVFITLTVGLPYVRPKVPVVQEAITVEFIQSDNKEQKQKKPPPKKNNKPQSAPKNTAEKPPSLKPVEKPIEKPDAVKKPPPKNPITKPKIAEKPKTKPKKKEPPKKETVQQETQFSSLLKNLQESENITKQEEKPPELPDPNATASSFANQISASEISAVKEQIQGFWIVPSGAKNARNLVIETRIMVNPDRTVRSIQVVDSMRMSRDPFFRAAAESAVRAIRQASPLELPPNKYEQWNLLVLFFDPRDML